MMPQIERAICLRNNMIVSVCAVMIIGLMVGRGLGPEMVLLDRFHEGEFFANSMEYIGNGETIQRGLPIHGLLNILPSMLTASIWGAEYNFIPTYALLKALDFGAALELVLIAALLTPPARHRMWVLIALCVIAPFVVGRRDFFILLTLLQFVVLVQSKSDKLSLIPLLLFGILAGFAMFFSNDRGIAGTVSLGAATLYLAWFERRFFISIGAFISTVLVFSLSSDLFDLSWYLRNIQYLTASSPEWRYPWTHSTVLYVSFAFLLNAVVLFALWTYRAGTLREPRSLAIPIALTLLSFMMLKIGTNRADLAHIQMAAWVPCLSAMSLRRRLHFKLRSWQTVIILACLALASIFVLSIFICTSKTFSVTLLFMPLFLLVVMFDLQMRKRAQIIAVVALAVMQIGFSTIYLGKTLAENKYTWMAQVLSPPSNAQASAPGVRWAADEILGSGAGCLFDMSNNGLVNGIAMLPSCSRFTYPVYAAPRYETLMIMDLAQANPPAIIYSSNYWSYRIDSRSMSERYPTLDVYLRQNFPVELCLNDYCIRKKS